MINLHKTISIVTDRRPTFHDVTDDVKKNRCRLRRKKRYRHGVFPAYKLQRFHSGGFRGCDLLGLYR